MKQPETKSCRLHPGHPLRGATSKPKKNDIETQQWRRDLLPHLLEELIQFLSPCIR
jgi:hypothetical protein